MTITATDDVFTLDAAAREATLLPRLAGLIAHHRERCPPYARILDALGRPERRATTLADLPWLPVRLFKTHPLASVPDDEVFKVVTSSGTTGEVSRIVLDRQAAAHQQRALSATLRAVLGADRLPMLLVDSAAVTTARPLSARGAGVLGMMPLGRDHTFLLDGQGRPDLGAVRGLLARHRDQPLLIFGFTFLVWRYLYPLAVGAGLDLSQGILLHSGGWKRLAASGVSNAEFRRRFAADTGLRRVHNYYGMVEQLGTLFLEGPGGGDLYCPDFADVIIRDPDGWGEQPVGMPGVIEVLSTLPRSYPGNVLLTEDLGVVHGVDDGDWPGRRFTVLGRLPRVEVRGCSDAAAVADR